MKYDPSPIDTAHDRKLYGVHSATITDTEDPQNKGRIKVTLNNRDDLEERWARVVRGMAGGSYGMHFAHDVGSEVLVTFENGEIEAEPFVVGSLHNEDETAPREINNQKNNESIHQLKTKTGLQLEFKDVGSAGNGEVPELTVDEESAITLSTHGGRSFTLDDGAGKVVLDDEFDNSITMDENGISIEDTNENSITMNEDGIHIDSPEENKVTAPEINVKGDEINIKGDETTIKGKTFVDIEGGTADLHGEKRTTVSSDKTTTVKAPKKTTVQSKKSTAIVGKQTTVKGKKTLAMQSPTTTLKGKKTLTMSGKTATLKGKATTVKGKKTTVTGKKTAVKGKKTSVMGKKTTVTGKKTSIVGKKTSVTGKKTSIVGKKTSVAGAKTSIAGKKTSIVGKKTSIAGLSVSVAAGGKFMAMAPIIMLN